jgi:elongator complex protein 2
MIGHEDWIRDLDVCQLDTNPNQLLIASCSQDNYIRLWKLDTTIINDPQSIQTSNNTQQKIEEVVDEIDEEDVVVEDDLKLKSSLFTLHSTKLNAYVQYSITVESVLYGHEDWIYSLKFHPKMLVNKGVESNEKQQLHQPLTLISASMDKTLVVWTYNEENSVWIDVARVGDIGGTTLGFYGATFDAKGEFIVAHGYQGALHLWKRDPTLVSVMET